MTEREPRTAAEPLSAEEEARIRSRHRSMLDLNEAYERVIERLLATLDAARAAAPQPSALQAALDVERLAQATAQAWRSLWSESASLGWHFQCWFDEDVIRLFENGDVAEAIAAEYAVLSESTEPAGETE